MGSQLLGPALLLLVSTHASSSLMWVTKVSPRRCNGLPLFGNQSLSYRDRVTVLSLFPAEVRQRPETAVHVCLAGRAQPTKLRLVWQRGRDR